MTLAVLINGERRSDVTHAIDLNDRGLHYGDGLFETVRIVQGVARFLDAHLARLLQGCARLQIHAPSHEVFAREVASILSSPVRDAVLKIIVTRGAGQRGYRPEPGLPCHRILTLYAAPPPYPRCATVQWRQTRLARNAALAGLKHLNRLEQVLAQLEPAAADEGLLLDTEGELVCGVTSNVFLVKDGVLTTPDLRFAGVRGVMRAQVLQAAGELRMPIEEAPVWPEDLRASSEVFLTSALRGVQSVVQLDELCWPAGPLANRLREALAL